MNKLMQVAIVGALVCVMMGICACSKQETTKQEEQSSNQTQLIHVVIPLNAPDFTDECTNLPVRVVGNDAEGKQIEEISYVDPQGKGIELAPGDYSFAVIASPLAPDGHLFKVPEPGIGITLTEDAQKSGSYEVASDLSWNLVYADESEVTRAKVEEAYEYALKSPGQEELARSLYGEYTDDVK